MSENIHYYSKHAETLSQQYNSIDFEKVHQEWLSDIPEKGFALDVGAGSGRDARFLAAKGLSVVAVEPADGIREKAQQFTVSQSVHWLNDKLPELSQVFSLQIKFDLILLSAVWMHIAPSQRERCIRKLSALLKANGKIVISLRHGACDDERTMYPVSADELADYARKFGLSFKLLSEQKNTDQLGRQDVYWQTVTLTLPDDGSGAFPLLRNIIVNDSKSSTYKVALLRTLLRIAEGHPGAVVEQTSEHVVLPLGLVALYWVKLFKPLVDHFKIPQSSNTNRGLGFVKETGWNQLSSFSANDFYIGAMYMRPEIADAVYRTLKDAASTIKDMPVRYTTLPGTTRGVFHAEMQRTTKPAGSVVIDADFLTSFGRFYVPTAIWDSLTRFSFWIEPSLVNEWAALMQRYTTGTARNITQSDLLQALTWEDPRRTTTRVRTRVEQLLTQDAVSCCWSGKALKANDYAVDHAMPFSRWPNNDLWNLLPTKTKVNATKSDKLPSSFRMVSSKGMIQEWWKQAWAESAGEFFIQANLSLPNLPTSNRSFDDVFEAMVMQRDRIKDFQQLEEW
ncbi:class I SAM-dependent methyltransferase [Alteromonas gilva]|uniref:Class I SAM-dependent methyltransferase n=1 Tax=Alteromonas gilva TaxID=2987522 RepID=A0ABT5L481_9ALTE|nr:class I SAM-dependent methyltransferase [Alteromonas gilva]MDC8831858.1 class I SAM-dependent methyltransferase [Alteromonas gilva]